jgi:hypothetical protein
MSSTRHLRVPARPGVVIRRRGWWFATPPVGLLAALAVGAISLAACGSSSKPSRSASAGTQALKFAHCMRANGVTNYPDPSSNGRPVSLNPISANSPAFQTAYNACRKNLPGGQPGPPPPTAAQARAGLAFARCMRAHGVPNFPDPLSTYGSGFTLGTGEYFPNTPATEFQSPASRQAAKACGHPVPAQLP